MALLISFLLVFGTPQVFAASFKDLPKSVLFDRGNSQNSIGVIGDQIFQTGDLIENYKVMGFGPRSIITHELETEDAIQWPAEDVLPPELLKEARYFFIARQLKVIHQAQVDFIARYPGAYATSLDMLMKRELLADGFEEGKKQDYFFEVIGTRTEYGKTPGYQVLASPAVSIAPDLFFYVDELGGVRFADTQVQAPWGPDWEYADHGRPRSTDISVFRKSEKNAITS